jgi:hypothetical protein
MDKFKFKSQFKGSTIEAKSQLDLICTNNPGNECKYGVIEAY